MNTLPRDLIPLPTMPYDERPVELPLDVEECRTAIWYNRGNVTKAAAMLKISPMRLRRFVTASPRLSAELDEAAEQLLDMAQDNVAEALADDSDAQRRDNMSKFVLKELGGKRGYGSAGKGITLKPGTGSGRFVIEWGDGSSISEPADEGQVIDHE